MCRAWISTWFGCCSSLNPYCTSICAPNICSANFSFHSLLVSSFLTCFFRDRWDASGAYSSTTERPCQHSHCQHSPYKSLRVALDRDEYITNDEDYNYVLLTHYHQARKTSSSLTCLTTEPPSCQKPQRSKDNEVPTLINILQNANMHRHPNPKH